MPDPSVKTAAPTIEWCHHCGHPVPDCACDWDDPGDEGHEPETVRCAECDDLVDVEDTWDMDDGSVVCDRCCWEVLNA